MAHSVKPTKQAASNEKQLLDRIAELEVESGILDRFYDYGLSVYDTVTNLVNPDHYRSIHPFREAMDSYCKLERVKKKAYDSYKRTRNNQLQRTVSDVGKRNNHEL